MSVSITINPGVVFLSGNPSLFTLQGSACYSQAGIAGTTNLILPFPATYEPYSSETDPAFNLYNDYFDMNFYCKNNPVSNGYNLDLAENFASLSDYLDDCLERLKQNPYLQKYFYLTHNGSYIIMQARSEGILYAITCDALRLIGVSRVNTPYQSLAYLNSFYKLGLNILKNTESGVSIEKSPVPVSSPEPYFDPAENIFNISSFIFNLKTSHFSFPADNDIINRGFDIYDKIHLVPYEKYGNPQVEYPGLAAGVFYALNGILSKEKFADLFENFDDFLDYITIPDLDYSSKFLTNQPNPKTIDIYQPEKLYWLSLYGSSYASYVYDYQFKIKLKLYYEDSNETITINTITIYPYQIIEIPANYRFIIGFASNKVYSYEIWIENSASQRRSDIFEFIVDRTYRRNARYFFAQNPYGVYDSFRTTGLAEKINEISKEIIDLSDPETDITTTDRKLQLSEDKYCRYKINTGYKDKLTIAWFMELMQSRHVVILIAENYYPVKIQEGKYGIDDDDEPFEDNIFECELENDIINSETISKPVLPDSGIFGRTNADDTNKDFDSFSFEPVNRYMADTTEITTDNTNISTDHF